MLVIFLLALVSALPNLLFMGWLIFRPEENQGKQHNQVDLAGVPVFQDIAQVVVLLVDISESVDCEAGETK